VKFILTAGSHEGRISLKRLRLELIWFDLLKLNDIYYVFFLKNSLFLKRNEKVFVGRAMIWGIVVGGAEGGRKCLEILREEFDLTMALSGIGTIILVLHLNINYETNLLTKKLILLGVAAVREITRDYVVPSSISRL